MSLEFAIIPITSTFMNVAQDIQTKLNETFNLDMTIIIDANYHKPINTRIRKWEKQDYDIITIDQDFYESNTIVVRFSDKGSRPQIMEVDELIDLIASFEDEHENNSNLSTENNTNTNNVVSEGGCIIM